MSFSIEPSTEISHRTDFSLLCNARGYKDAIEIGVDQAVFAKDFLSRFAGNWLFLVDPYVPHLEFPYDRSGDQLVAALALAPYHGRYRFVRATSADAARWVPTVIRPEFVYIDAGHGAAEIREDLLSWWPLIADHGMLAGHDFDDGHPDVVATVTQFAKARDLVVRLTHEEREPKSWYIYRREPETLYHRLFRDAESPNPHHPPRT